MNDLLNNSELQFVFVGGKGGVGKTTSSCALAIRRALAQKDTPGGKTLLVSTDPAHNLSDAFNQQFDGTPKAVQGCKVLDDANVVLECLEIDPSSVMEKEFGEVVSGLQDDIVRDFRQWLTSVPGIDEAMALAQVLSLVDSNEYKTLIFDTAPTGHTLRLLHLPQVLETGIKKLQSWQTRIGGLMTSIASTITRSNDAAAQGEALNRLKEKLNQYHVQIQRIAAIFKDHHKTTFVCVCIAEHLSVFETVRLVKELREGNIACSHLLVNQLVPRGFMNMSVDDDGKSKLPLQSLSAALRQMGLDIQIVDAAKEACELCGARAAIQGKYLKQLQGSLGESHTIVRLPLLPREVRGPDHIAEFSVHMIERNAKLEDSAESASSTKGNTSDAEMLATLNALLAKRGKDDQESEEANNSKKQASMDADSSPKIPALPESFGPSPMVLLMKLQGVLTQPNGLQKMLSHERVVASRASNPLVKEFCDAIEEKGPMAGLAFMGRPDVMNALGEVLPGVIDEVSASSAGSV